MRVTSIRSRLLSILIVSTGLIWISAVAWIYLSTQAEVERVLDARLTEAARMVNSLLAERRIELAMASDSGSDTPAPFAFEDPSYERQLSCQIWSLDGKLLGRSEHAPNGQLTEASTGFSQSVINGETWRVYAIENAELGVRVIVGDSIAVRDRLVGDVVKGLAFPAALILPFLAGVIWISVRKGMRPLSDMANALSSRAANDLRPLPQTNLPDEIVPAVHALNGLVQRVEDAREREKNFTAFAAHELKTPLAGLKTQAQVALASQDGDVHENALRQIVAGVDRTSRLVRQLLDLSSVEASARNKHICSVNVADLIARICNELPFGADRVTVTGAADTSLHTDTVLFTLAMRNLIENALIHSQGTVQVGVEARENVISVIIEDEGPGICQDELPRVTERFFRGRAKSPAGSGLGLSIVKEAAERLEGTLILENRSPAGLRASFTIPAQAQ